MENPRLTSHNQQNPPIFQVFSFAGYGDVP